MELVEKILFCWNVVADFVRDITIPPSDDNWGKWKAIITLLISP